MHVRSLKLHDFKGFSDLELTLERTPKLVVLCGPNGVGKSSVFDAFRSWAGQRGAGGGWSSDQEYFIKQGAAFSGDWGRTVDITFDEDLTGADQRKRIYVRTAHRNDPEFSNTAIQRPGDLLDVAQPRRMIDNDVRVTENYQRLVGLGINALYSGNEDQRNVGELREKFVGELRDRVLRLFPDLALEGLGDPLQQGTFLFTKGESRHFVYKNLSGGEKAAFDLLLDVLVKREYFDRTVFCIDEPEAHLNTRVQGPLLRELVDLIGADSQLWVATHSLGMFRTAVDLERETPGSVAFIDFGQAKFDESTRLYPTTVTRDFWARNLDVALGDVAELVAPKRLVLCEGTFDARSKKAEFDARCYRAIFGDVFPDTDFVSVGDSEEVQHDALQLGRSFQALVSGTETIRLIDRDLLTDQEVQDREAEGIRVLSRRHLEAFLLDDEILRALAAQAGQTGKASELLEAKERLIENAVTERGKDRDDLKAIAGPMQVETRRILGLTAVGSNADAFLSDVLAPLVGPGTDTFRELSRDVFGV